MLVPRLEGAFRSPIVLGYALFLHQLIKDQNGTIRSYTSRKDEQLLTGDET